MSEVGALIIKLQAETAQFREDMGKVKQDLDGLKGPAKEAGDTMDFSMSKARGSLMLVEESVGVHLPRHLNSLIAEIPGVGAAFSAMLPLVGVVAAIAIIAKLIEKHKEMKDEAILAQQAMTNSDTGIANSLRDLGDKLLHVGAEADELRGKHLAAVKKELQIINDQKLTELQNEFQKLDTAANAVFAHLKAGTFELGDGSAGAKAELDRVLTTYNNIVALNENGLGDEKATTFLKAKVTYNQQILALMKQAKGVGLGNDEADQMKFYHARAELGQKNIGYTQKELDSQTELVSVLNAQVEATKKIEAIAAGEQHNISEKGHLKGLSEEATRQKIIAAGVDAHAAAVRKLTQTQAEAALVSSKGDGEQSIDSKLDKEKQAIEIEKTASITAAQQILASKTKLYESDLKAFGKNAEKKKELDAQYANEVDASDDAIAQANADASKKINAVEAAASAEKTRIQTMAAQQAADDSLHLAIEGAKRKEQFELQAAKNEEALHQKTAKQTTAMEVAAVNAETQAEVKAYNDRIKNLDKFAIDYEKKVKALQDKIVSVEQQGKDRVTQINNAAEQKQLADVRNAEERMENAVAENVAKSIFEHKNMAKSFEQLGEQMIEGMVKQLIMAELFADKKKLIDAKTAFHNAMADVPWPLNMVVAPAMFAATMAFEQGGKIPGAGAVPIVGHGGETVVTKALTDRVESAEGKGGSSGHTFNLDLRGAAAGVGPEVQRAIREMGHQAVARSVAAVQDRAGRR